MAITTHDEIDPAMLHDRMVGALIEGGHLRSSRVIEAMRAVQRHAFLPGSSPREAYEDTHVVTKWGPQGQALSSASAPWIVADMLEDLDARPGHDILEIGAGTGYNAALLSELVGSEGSVTSVDIDPEVTAAARAHLDTTGYTAVRVITGDGLLGSPDRAPYDRIIVTVGCWDIPTAWWRQLTDPGRLVMPLRWRGDSRVIAFARRGDTMTADRIRMGGFIPMRHHEGAHTFTIAPSETTTVTCDPDQNITESNLTGVFEQERVEAWTDATVGKMEPWDVVWLRMASLEPGACRLATSREAIDNGHTPTGLMACTHALVDGPSMAHFAIRPAQEPDRWQLGAIGYGGTGHELAQRICGHIRAWSPNRSAVPTIHAWYESPGAGGIVIPKAHTPLTTAPPNGDTSSGTGNG